MAILLEIQLLQECKERGVLVVELVALVALVVLVVEELAAVLLVVVLLLARRVQPTQAAVAVALLTLEAIITRVVPAARDS